ncbi:MAG TPA: hypothetical protein VD970_18010 [Acetobacteraceae bacterium]|nr:hypothetical protein [Acetobacteraceae bacterium]
MPWGENLGQLPRLQSVDGKTLVRMAAETRVHHVVGADELEAEPLQEIWHDFADCMRDVCDSAADLSPDEQEALGRQLDSLIAELRGHGVRVLVGQAGAFLYVAIVLRTGERDLLKLFARS